MNDYLSKIRLSPLKVVLCGGGTAGHVWPLVAVARELSRSGISSFLYLGSYHGIEADLARKEGITYQPILTGKFRRYLSIYNLIDPFKFFLGIFQAIFVLKRFGADVLLAKGGYVSLPVVLAAGVLRIPVITHESDVVIGLSNKIAARFAKKVAVGFPADNYPNLNPNKVIYTGIPVREEYLRSSNNKTKLHKKALETFHFQEDRPVILFAGGTLGAHRINQLLLEILPQLLEKFQVILLSGPDDLNWLAKEKDKLNPVFQNRYYLASFLGKEMVQALSLADLVVTRSGANTLAEISALGRTAILIPFPYAAQNHQAKNAQIFQQEGAAIVVSQEKLTSSSLLDLILRLMEDEKLRQEIARKAHSLSMGESAKIMVREIVDLAYNR